MKILSRGSGLPVGKLVGVGFGIVLAVAVIADTRFLSPDESATHHQQAFDPATYAAETFPELLVEISEQATDLPVLAAAADEDLAEAGASYGNDLGAGQYAFPVRLTGTVDEVDEDFVTLSVAGMPEDDSVRIPLGAALSGIPVRDATGSISFGDFSGQTDFQAVANEFKFLIQEQVLAPVEPETLAGQELTVLGAWGTGGPPDLYLIQPVSIEVAADGGGQ